MGNTKKFDWQSVDDDFEKMQRISGVAGALGIIIGIVITFTSNLPEKNFINIALTMTAVIAFSCIYYLTPSLLYNKKLIFLPDVFFIFGIASMMYNTTGEGEVFVIFLIFLIAMDAFLFTSQLFYVILWGAVISFLTVHYLQGTFSSPSAARIMIFEVYGILSVGIILRNFAEKGISLRKSREDLAKKTRLLRTQKKEIYMIINNLSEGFIAVDNNKSITFINQTALKLLGMVINPKRLVGKNIDDILPIAAPEGKISIVDQALSENKSIIRDDLRLVRAERTMRIHTNTAPILGEDKYLSGALVLFRDITSKKELDEQRAEFNAIASHELRTPLTLIEGYLYYLLTDKNLKFDKKTGEYIKKSYEAAEALLHLSNDILTVIKSDENEIKVALENIDVKSIVKETAKEFQAKAKEKKITINTKFADELPNVVSDKQKIKEILINLLENALKFTEKGSITIEANRIDDKKIVIKVTDTGLGIRPEDQKMIFHKFFRTEDWQTRKTGGTGLGLYIAKTLTERLGGNISVESKVGVGSTFSFTIPLQLKKLIKKKNEKELREFIKSI